MSIHCSTFCDPRPVTRRAAGLGAWRGTRARPTRIFYGNALTYIFGYSKPLSHVAGTDRGAGPGPGGNHARIAGQDGHRARAAAAASAARPAGGSRARAPRSRCSTSTPRRPRRPSRRSRRRRDRRRRSPATSPTTQRSTRGRRGARGARPHRRARQQRRLGRLPSLRQDQAGGMGQLIAINLTGALNMHHAVLPEMAQRRARPRSSTSPPTPRASAPRARRSTPPARRAWSPSPRPSRASTRATASRQRRLSRPHRNGAVRRLQRRRRQSGEAEGGVSALHPARPHRPARRPSRRDPVLRQRRRRLHHRTGAQRFRRPDDGGLSRRSP